MPIEAAAGCGALPWQSQEKLRLAQLFVFRPSGGGLDMLDNLSRNA